MIWSTLLLTATLATPTMPSGDGQPPVTIIVIPEVTTTTATATVPTHSLVLPETPVPTTTPPSATSPRQVEGQLSPPLRWPSQWKALVAMLALFVLGLVSQRSTTLTANSPAPEGPGPPSSEAPAGGLVLALRHYKPVEGENHAAPPVPEPPAAVSPSTSIYYEAVEYRSDFGSSAVNAHSLGEFGTVEAAINTARMARSSFVLNSGEAFWVVWNQQLKRAAWIAEAGTPGESVVDLRTPAARLVYRPSSKSS